MLQPKERILIKTVENDTKLVLPGKQHPIEFTRKSSLAKIKKYNTCIDGGQ